MHARLSRTPFSLFLTALCLLAGLPLPGQDPSTDFVSFESGHVRPIAITPSGEHLLAVNTPDNRLEIFSLSPEGLPQPVGETPVGLEPVALATDSRQRVYVVNHLSDSVSVVDLRDPARPYVVETLQVGDEPRDVVVGGTESNRLFVTTARRGQNRPSDPELTTEGRGRADVWVFDLDDLDSPPRVISLFTDTPRALAVSADGASVYVAGFRTGNQTTCLTARAVSPSNADNDFFDDGFRAPGPPPPLESADGRPAPEVGLIVGYDRELEKWVDELGRDWSPRLRFHLPDRDVFRLDARQDPPVVADDLPHVGTIIFNLAVNPTDGRVYASNLESRNRVRFEPVLNGHLAESRITVMDFEAGTAEPVHLNPHIDHSTPSGPAEEIEQSLAFPMDLVFSADGETLYTTAHGSSLVAVLDREARVQARIAVGGGPSGLALSSDGARLYVMSRFEHAIDVVDLASRERVASIPLGFNPEPEVVRVGRPILYDARNSGHGDSACFSCHIFGDLDDLAWDLGDPDGESVPNPLERVAVQAGLGPLADFHPMKGPMTTQSLRGLRGAGAMHWRGDRNGVNSGAPDPDVNDEGQAFLHFRGAFQSLLGMEEPLPEESMEQFRDFMLEVVYPPNPIAELDGSLTPLQEAGQEIFDSSGSRFGLGGDGDACADCHATSLGTSGQASFELESQEFKVAHLRNLYQKVGMFGQAGPDIIREPAILAPTPTPHLGDQVRGFGFLHDGSIPTLFNFFRVRFAAAPPFTFPDQPGRSGNQKVRELEAFLLAFPTGLAPVVGQQVTLVDSPTEFELDRLELLETRARAGDCDLVVRVGNDESNEGLLLEGVAYRADREESSLSRAELLDRLAESVSLTFTAVPPGTGFRIALDRDRDGHLDGDERAAGTDPSDPGDFPVHSFLRGNCNGDAGLDLADPVSGLLYLFAGGQEPPCLAACDSNGLDGVDIADMTFLLEYLFLGGPAPDRAAGCEPVEENCETPACPG